VRQQFFHLSLRLVFYRAANAGWFGSIAKQLVEHSRFEAIRPTGTGEILNQATHCCLFNPSAIKRIALRVALPRPGVLIRCIEADEPIRID
jgi:hypothetical protein